MARDELDEDDFQKSLKRVVSSDRLPAQIFRAIRLDNESRLIKPNKLREFVYKLNRVSLKGICDLNRVNFIGVSLMDNNRKRRLTFRQKLDRLLNDKTRKTNKTWPILVLVIFLLCAVFTSFAGYYLYIYDANKTKLEKLQEHLSGAEERYRLVNGLHLDVERLKRDFECVVNQTREILRPLGGNYIEWSYVSECILVLSSQIIDWVVIFPISHQVGNSVWLSVQAILNQDDEHRTRYELILSELERFRRDSLLFARVKLELFCHGLARTVEKRDTCKDRSGGMRSDEIDKCERTIMAQHHRIMGQLKCTALEGRLNPFNRTPVGRDKLALVYLTTILTFSMNWNLIFWLGIYHFHIYFEDQTKLALDSENHLGNALAIGSVLVLIEIGIVAATLMSTIMTLAVFDQLELSKHLRAWICHVISMNELRCRDLRDMEAGASDRHQLNEYQHYESRQRYQRHLAHDIEQDLLVIIIQCRLTTRTFLLVKEPIGKIVSVVVNLAISIPIVFCIHSAYFKPELKLIILKCCLATTLAALISLACLGLFYRRTIRSFGTIWTLVAQLSYYESVPSVNKHLRLDSSITLFTLRRQLADMRFTMDKFTIRWLTLPITYINLIRIFSWTLFFMMAGSILSVRLFGEGFGSILADPFGLYKFLKERPRE